MQGHCIDLPQHAVPQPHTAAGSQTMANEWSTYLDVYCFTTFKLQQFLVKFGLLKLETSRTVILPQLVSVL